MGENGAGKSTLMAVAAGAIIPDSGDGRDRRPRHERSTPPAAQALGLAVVYQHPSVLEDLTVAENMVLSMPPGRRPPMGRRAGLDAGSDWLSSGATHRCPGARAGDLSVAEHQLLEIARALALEAQVLILDEPTESLTAAETERCSSASPPSGRPARRSSTSPTACPRSMRIADRVTVLRDGEVRGTFPAARRLRGRHPAAHRRAARSTASSRPGGRPAAGADRRAPVRVAGLTGHAASAGVDLRRSGRARSWASRASRATASASSCGRSRGIGPRRPRASVRGGRHGRSRLGDPGAVSRAGLVHLPGDRHREGLFLSLSVRENVSLLALPGLDRDRVMVRRDREAALARDAGRPPGHPHARRVETPVGALSGGNQQKVLIARSMLAQPRVLLADEPTRGVDVGARVEIYRILRDAAEAGQVVVVLSSDAVELQGLCDRVLVFSRGRWSASSRATPSPRRPSRARRSPRRPSARRR